MHNMRIMFIVLKCASDIFRLTCLTCKSQGTTCTSLYKYSVYIIIYVYCISMFRICQRRSEVPSNIEKQLKASWIHGSCRSNLIALEEQIHQVPKLLCIRRKSFHVECVILRQNGRRQAMTNCCAKACKLSR